MRVLKGLVDIEITLVDGLKALEAAQFALRAFCDSKWHKNANDKDLRKLGRILREYASAAGRAHPIPAIRELVQELANLVGEKLVRHLADFCRMNPIGTGAGDEVAATWERNRFLFENEVIKSVAPPFLDRLGHNPDASDRNDRGVLCAVWSLPFEPKKNADLSKETKSIQAEVQEKGVWPATNTREITYFLGRRSFFPVWPDVKAAIRRVQQVCRTYRKEGSKTLEPTVEGIAKVVEKFVNDLIPQAACGISESELAMRVREGIIDFPGELAPRTLQGLIARKFSWAKIPTKMVRDAVWIAEREGAIRLVPLDSSRIYLPSSITSKQQPRWDAKRRELEYKGLRKRYSRNKSENQTIILTVFEEMHWPYQIDDPLPGSGGKPAKRRLRAAVTSLNKSLSGLPMQFGMDGTGEGLIWKDAP